MPNQAREKRVLSIEGFSGSFEKRVTRFGNGAKIDCPKVYLGRKVFVVVCLDSGTLAEQDSVHSEPAAGGS
ncbi:MAG: DUF2080 family transposase-associated protein [Thermoplasmata archaeon]|nr:DUF2080 family transposase-associated protein [Thermoplasmata archaeon]